jgi:hypothetical protein
MGIVGILIAVIAIVRCSLRMDLIKRQDGIEAAMNEMSFLEPC